MRIRINENRKKKQMTYPIYLLSKRFPKDIVGLILSFMWQCDVCGDLMIGQKYRCDVCLPLGIMCRYCYDIKAMSDHTNIWGELGCPICGSKHCKKYRKDIWTF